MLGLAGVWRRRSAPPGALALVLLGFTMTLTAHRFYQNRGWEDDGPAIDTDGLKGWPMAKTLAG